MYFTPNPYYYYGGYCDQNMNYSSDNHGNKNNGVEYKNFNIEISNVFFFFYLDRRRWKNNSHD
jgi:hypothetical protein